MERAPPILLTPPMLSDATPAESEGSIAAKPPAPKPPRLEPTRYGDWELNGKCVDF